MEFEPATGVIKPKYEMELKAHLFVHCTTVINAAVNLVASRSAKLIEDIPVDDTGQITEWKNLERTQIPLELETKLSVKLDPDELVLHNPPIGEGGFGSVYRGTWRGQEVAVKMIKNQNSAETMDTFTAEVNMMERLRANQIITFIGAVYIPGKLAVVTEFMALGNLATCMKHNAFSPLLKIKCLLDCARGMNFLHTSGVLHRDLKGDNLLMVSLDELAPVNCKISDFGTTRDVQTGEGSSTLTRAMGTPIFMSPEALECGSYTVKTDVYSFAIIALHLATEKEPYSGDPEFNSPWKITQFVISGKRLEIPSNVHEAFRYVISKSWAHNPAERPTFDDLANYLEGTYATMKAEKTAH